MAAVQPLDLLRAREGRVEPFITPYYAHLFGGTVGFLAACFVNYGSRRPWYSGLQKHVIFVYIGASLMAYSGRHREIYLAEKDATLRHYVELHPEDFVAAPRRKYADVLEPWTPIR